MGRRMRYDRPRYDRGGRVYEGPGDVPREFRSPPASSTTSRALVRAGLAAAVEEGVRAGVEVRRLPAIAALACRSCGHRGTARVPPERKEPPRFQCSRCGSHLVKVRLG